MAKPSIPKGTRDFGQLEMARRNYIFDTIKSVFSLYGFQQIETPAMENIGTLMGKYGEEGDKLLFRIQNSGEKASLAPEKGLRYDLTVPFARYVVQHREELSFQTFPDSARLACRPSAERTLPRVLSMRRGCHWFGQPAR